MYPGSIVHSFVITPDKCIINASLYRSMGNRMKKKRNIKAIIITAMVLLIGILLILAGLFGGWFLGLFSKGFDYDNVQPEDLGKPVKADIRVFYNDIGMTNKALQAVGDFDDVYAFILLDFSDMGDSGEHLYYSKYYQNITIQGTLRAITDDETEEIKENLFETYDPYYYERKERGDWEDVTLDDFHKILVEEMVGLVPYCIEVKSIGSFNWTPFLHAGVIILLASLVLEICFVFKLKKKIVLPVVYGLLIIVPTVLFFDHIRTMLTVKKVGDSLYTMKNLECTDMQGLLDSGVSSTNELFDWISDNHLYGIKINFDLDDIGCSAFAATTPEGDHLFGRNFDFFETDEVLVYSHPEGCYESIGVADLGVLGVGWNCPISPDSATGRFIMTITPYIVVDGMNEKGVGAGILQLNLEDTHQDNGKPDLLIFCAIRAILDKCASVDEALALLYSYDIQSDLGSDYHLFITDRTGRYAVVEWLDGEMVVVEHPCCTNSVVAPGEYYDMGDPDDRLPTLEGCLGSGQVYTESEAMALLEKVKSNKMTEWSCVYNLDDFTVSICLEGDFEKVYTFSVDELR